jgi:HlyD family secretion protein
MPDPRRSINGNIRLGLVVMLALGGTAAAWASLAPLAGAVIGSGQVAVESNVKKVQHPTGGVIGELRVREGQKVEAGEILLRLDETQLKARLRVYLDQLSQLKSRAARLRAERDGVDAIAFPADLVEVARTDEEAARAMAGETRIFEARRNNRDNQRKALNERIGQLREENQGNAAQLLSTQRMGELANGELAVAEEMFRKNLALRDRIFSIRREVARVEGQVGALKSTIAANNGKIAEIDVQILQLDKEFDQRVAEELRDAEGKIAELEQRRIEAEDLLSRVDIRAPSAGFVHQLSVHTVGGVVPAGEPIMLIVPQAESLIIEARISPADIDEVHAGMPARLRFSAFRRNTPELQGTVFRVSADRTDDPQSKASYYTVGVKLNKGEAERLEQDMVPGMPVETFITTGNRTFFSYIFKPLTDAAQRAFRES